MSQKTALYQLTRKSRKKNITSHNQNDHLGRVNNRFKALSNGAIDTRF